MARPTACSGTAPPTRGSSKRSWTDHAGFGCRVSGFRYRFQLLNLKSHAVPGNTTPETRNLKPERIPNPESRIPTPMYIELHAASAFSFLQGASLPESLIDRAAALGYPALALLDADGVYGAPRFHKAAG